ncbi:MAG: hypothetical protein WBF22_06280 [Methylocella sp.]
MAVKADGEFQIALAMSGAISAGAYTAGVFDFLIQALDEWDNAKNGKYLEKGDDPGTIPNHFVGIKAMSGASAGAIAAAIGAVALADAGQKPRDFDTPRDGEQKIKCYLPKLYEVWVVKPGLVAEGEEKIDFLQTSDLDAAPEAAGDFSRTHGIPGDEGEPRPVTSLLNSRLLDGIARAALDVKHVTDSPRPYISKTLHIYMTLSNLRGVPYSVPFGGGTEAKNENCYHMISHGDRVHYAVTGLGTWNSKSDFADNDQKREIAAAGLVIPGNPDWKDYAVCALASAAFPVGLAPRLIGATLGKVPTLDEYEGRRLPTDALLTMSPTWLPTVRAEDPFWFTTADGGIIDNNPFEYARFSLKDGDKMDQRIEPALDKVDRAVIMVSPFPELKPIAPEGRPASDLLSTFSALLPALIDQARFKPSEIILAAEPKQGSRYLIGPSRVIDDGTPDGKEQRYGIASGLLGGFGGFVARSFRDHDFQLGRRNCQRFLQDAFALPPENEIIKGWIDGAGARSHRAFKAIPSQDMPDAYPIIPLFGTAKAEVVLLAWPRISQARFEKLQTRIAERFDAAAPRLLAQNVTGPLYFLLWLAVRPFPWGIGLIRKKALNFVRPFMLADLVRRDLIEGWELPPTPGLDGDDIRLVLAELINPAYNLRNVAGLAKAAGLDRAKVEAVLALGQGPAASGKNFEVWRAPSWTDNKVWRAPRTDHKAGGSLYTLMSRKPAWNRWFWWRYFGWLFDLVLGPKRSDAWLAKPAVDKPGV